MNTTENNKLIAEFMEIHEIMLDEYGKYGADDIIIALNMTMNPCVHFNTPLDVINQDELKFHTSWDWLMPVVKKLIDLDNDDVLLEHLAYTDNNQLLVMETKESAVVNTLKRSYTTVEDTHKAVVEFIKWYNENK